MAVKIRKKEIFIEFLTLILETLITGHNIHLFDKFY